MKIFWIKFGSPFIFILKNTIVCKNENNLFLKIFLWVIKIKYFLKVKYNLQEKTFLKLQYPKMLKKSIPSIIIFSIVIHFWLIYFIHEKNLLENCGNDVLVLLRQSKSKKKTFCRNRLRMTDNYPARNLIDKINNHSDIQTWVVLWLEC